MSDNEKVSEPSVEEFLRGIKSNADDRRTWVLWLAYMFGRRG